MAVQKRTRRRPLWFKIVVGLCVLILVLVGSSLAIITFWPDVAAKNIDRLRDVIGDAPVAQLEAVTLSIQDRVQQLQYQAGLAQPSVPWAVASPQAATPQPTVAQPTATPHTLHNCDGQLEDQASSAQPTIQRTPQFQDQASSAQPTNQRTPPLPTSATQQPIPVNAKQIVNTPTSPQTAPPKPANPPAPVTNSVTAWQLSSLPPYGKLMGEGLWSPYVQTSDGTRTLAYRTFLQPDPQRPYSIAAIVAFDLQATRLHYVLGTVDPVPLSPQAGRTGTIPAADDKPGVLLATFNGGFKARHGQYGAMANGLIALPPIDGLATVGIYANGLVRIGEWSQDIKDSPDLVAWRQNGVPLIHNGQINPETGDTNVRWGRTIKGDSVTWRSAIGLSADGRTLYYVAGPHLDVPILAKVMATAGSTEAMQLDVNDFWVQFAAIRSSGSNLIAEPLLTNMKDTDRYLRSSDRDFFYVTMAAHP